MRDFLRRGKPRISTIDVALMFTDTLCSSAPRRHRSTSRSISTVPVDPPSVHGDRIQIQQVILNLIRNSIDSIVESGRTDGRLRLAVQAGDSVAHLEIRVSRQRGRNSAGSGGATLHSAYDLEEERAGSWSLHFAGDCRSAWRAYLAPFSRTGYD